MIVALLGGIVGILCYTVIQIRGDIEDLEVKIESLKAEVRGGYEH